MKTFLRAHLPFLLFLSLATGIYLAGVPGVPFHPDEATYLFTSSDADLFWRQPSDLFWQPEKQGDLRQHYRVMDAPLLRHVLALGRWIAGQPALPVDWDWSQSWKENQQHGALPSPGQLLAGRYAVAALFPLTLAFLFFSVKNIANSLTAWIAALLLATNALVLLHTRRAMAEGVLLCAVTCMLWSLTRAVKRPWLNAIPAALAFSAKQSLAALIPVGLLSVLWQPGEQRWARAARHSLLFAALLAAVIILLHPTYWQNTVPALRDAVRERQALIAGQVRDYPGLLLDTPAKKLVGMVGSLYMTPPMFAEAGNYAAATQPAELAYLANPLHALFRSIPAGGILLALGLFGAVMAARRAVSADAALCRGLVLALAATLFQAAALYALIPLAWQRYYLPLVPFTCLWAAYGINEIFYLGARIRSTCTRLL